MKQISVLLCDSDEAYLQSVSRFLAQAGFAVTMYSDTGKFSEDRGRYDTALLSPEFLAEKDTGCLADRVICLLDEREGGPAGYDSLYKFQNMDAFLARIQGRPKTDAGMPGLHFVCSPIHHELRLPFALALARIYAETGRTLFIDLSEASILTELMQLSMDEENLPYEKGGPDLIDLIYSLESREVFDRESQESGLPEEFVLLYDGFYYLPPAADARALSDVTKAQWDHLMKTVLASAFTSVVILSDRLPVHLAEWCGENSEIILLSKRGDFYRKSEQKYEDYFEERLPDVKRREVDLPMSAAGLSDGSWYLPSLLEGNLGNFVRECVGAAGN